MFYRKINNQYINTGMDFTIDGVSYGKDILKNPSQEILDLLGLEEVTVLNSPENTEFYSFTESYSGATLTYVNVPLPLSYIKEYLSNKVRNHRDYLRANGGCPLAEKWFHNDTESKQQQIALFLLGNNLPENLLWKTMDKSFILMTPDLARDLFLAQVSRESNIFNVSENKIKELETLSFEELVVYDIFAGFPEEFKDVVS